MSGGTAANGGGSMIEVDRVSKFYGPVRAVEEVSFSVARGEVLGFLGPNGAGKTTTMRIITGFTPPTSGTVRVAGFDALEEGLKARRRIGYLPESPPLYPEMTVRSYLTFIAAIREVPARRIKGRVDEVVDRLELQPAAGRLIQNLSKGYRQRVGLAQAIVHDPDVLVLDEPTAGLDPKQIIEIRELIKQLGRDHTIILSSHILPEVSQICGRVVIINRGRVVAVDTPQGLSRRLRQGQVLLARIKGPQERVLQVLGELPGVVSAQVGTPGEAPDYHVQTSPGQDVREPLFFKLAAAGFPILELRPVDLSLEEVFLQLTTEEVAAGD